MSAQTKADKILDILTPYFGAALARGALQLSCESIGAKQDALTPDHLAPLSKSIEKRLVIFLGTDKAAAVAEQVRTV